MRVKGVVQMIFLVECLQLFVQILSIPCASFEFVEQKRIGKGLLCQPPMSRDLSLACFCPGKAFIEAQFEFVAFESGGVECLALGKGAPRHFESFVGFVEKCSLFTR
jgi:hypothetical protein